jgi:imidazolonepropionase-like amidohydrolase
MSNSQILISHANVFDGKGATLATGMSVLVEDNKIAKIVKSITAPSGATVIDAKGRTLTPGFIGAHEHLMLQASVIELLRADAEYFALVGAKTAHDYLMHGWTTVRDVGGNTFSLKKVIDKGYLPGPRIYPSGPMISQTAGHADHRSDNLPHSLVQHEPDATVKFGHQMVADGRANVLTAVRENFRRGATQIKIAVGGGVGSESDPLDVCEYTSDEISAAVEAAADWGTYVMSHVYNSKGIRRAIDNGVKSIEHANLIDEETLQYMKDKGIWLSPQVIVYTTELKGGTADQNAKMRQAQAGTANLLSMAKKMGFENIAFGTDIVTDPEVIARMNDEFVLRTQWFEPAEVLHQATSKNAALCALCGPRNPYPAKLGVIEEGAYADLLLINGNPLQDISILAKHEENLALIMKDGKIYKNQI